MMKDNMHRFVISGMVIKKSVSVKRRLRTADCGPGVKYRLRVKHRLGAKCRIKTVDVFTHLCSFFSKSVK